MCTASHHLPTPSNSLRKGPSKNWPGNGGYERSGGEDTNINSTARRFNGMLDDEEATIEHGCGPNTGDSPADDQDIRAL